MGNWLNRHSIARSSALRSSGKDSAGFGRDLDGHEILFGIEIIFTRFVNDTDVLVRGCAIVGQHSVNLAHFKRFGIAAVIDAQNV